MSNRTIYIKVDQGGSAAGLLLSLVVIIVVVAGVYGFGMIQNTLPYYEKRMLEGTLTCEEYIKYLKEYYKYAEKEDKDLVKKVMNKNTQLLEHFYNRDKDETEKATVYSKTTEAETETATDGTALVPTVSRFEEYARTYNFTIPARGETPDFSTITCTTVESS